MRKSKTQKTVSDLVPHKSEQEPTNKNQFPYPTFSPFNITDSHTLPPLKITDSHLYLMIPRMMHPGQSFHVIAFA